MAMVVTPYPDDAELGCGGIIARRIGHQAEVPFAEAFRRIQIRR